MKYKNNKNILNRCFILRCCLEYIVTRIKTYLKPNKEQSLSEWLISYNPKYFLTVQFPMNKRSDDYEKSQLLLKNTMKNFERQLLGRRWNKKAIPFIAIAEINIDYCYHYHILIYDCDYSLEELKAALDKTMYNQKLTPETFDIKRIDNNIDNLCDYIKKCIKIYENTNIDSDKILSHTILFDL